MPSGEAEKLLGQMRASKAGWTANDLETVYCGYRFDAKEGGKHRLYVHPKYPELRATVTRHKSLPIGYVHTAIKLIDRLLELEKGEKHE